ncbi:UL21 [anatid alphaherpesvirus 1]|uniref:UL21 n=1 Tax=anatid alphaherpesvirus 1 TaxID=104388 RepID=G3GR20_9ALPH|nr:UL21 [Anatid alphaherpesvirus 1]AEN80104.1 UL21 [Anatid alphaherpesvirus 1]UEC79321.1 UL21 [Anatid alphaherpesvirus 1]UJO49834.1 UL21 [Anatid alphaherpesvirus 1]UJO49909.1 UL21 [Anatid alphaherpesvirus 1]WKE35621.1 UL21 [Anatid alphaherpesvirus 1]
MEFHYWETINHNGVTFYITRDGMRAYFACGGCILSVPRPPENDSDTQAELAKFGIALRGITSGDLVLSNYVRSELGRRGLKWIIGDGEVFIDSLDLLGHTSGSSERDLCGTNSGDGSTERDLCGALEVEVRDQCIAEYMVSLEISSGLILSTGHIFSNYQVIKLYDVPIITNASSGFIYEPNRNAFALMQARLTSLPQSLAAMVDGLFDRIAVRRRGVREETKQTDVIITGKRSFGTVLVKHGHGERHRGSGGGTLNTNDDCDITTTLHSRKHSRRGARKTTVSSFVQVKYIPAVLNIWEYGAGNFKPTRSLGALWTVFCRIGDVVSQDISTWFGLEPEFNDARARIGDAIEASFGNIGELFVGYSMGRSVSSAQKFALVQYILCKGGYPNCYPIIEHLCVSLSADSESFPEPPRDIHLLVDTTNRLFRESCIIWASSVAILSTRVKQLRVATDEDDSVMDDAETLFEMATDLLDTAQEHQSIQLQRIARLASIIAEIYTTNDLMKTAIRTDRCFGNSYILNATIDAMCSSIFDEKCDIQKGVLTLGALIDRRLKNAGLLG